MALTLAAANRRLARLEARRPSWAGYPPLEPPSEEFLAKVLRMLAEAGALTDLPLRAPQVSASTLEVEQRQDDERDSPEVTP